METTLWNAVPQLGVGGVLLAVVVYVLRQNYNDRHQYSVLQRAMDDKHVQDLAELRGQITELRSEVHALRQELEQQRRARWKAEDDAAHYRRIAGVTDD